MNKMYSSDKEVLFSELLLALLLIRKMLLLKNNLKKSKLYFLENM